MSDADRETWPYFGIEHPLENDVVYGRGGLANNHNGNKRFRAIVADFKKQYQKCSRHEKTALAETLVRQWRDQTPPGRFVKMNNSTGLWDDVGQKARSKCSQLLREGAPDIRKHKKPMEGAEYADDEEDDNSGAEDVPPPPPESPKVVDSRYHTPPKTKTSKDLEAVSPCSVMDRFFYSVEDVEAGARVRPESMFSKVLHGIRGKQTTQQQPVVHADLDSDAKPAAKPSPLRSFMHNMIKEKAPQAKKISIFQDNASPVRSKPAPVKRDILEHVASPLRLDSNHSSLTADMNEVIGGDCEIPRPRKISASKRNLSWGSRSLEAMAMEISVNKKSMSLGESEHSVSWKSVDMELEDDPILCKYASLCESSSFHRGSRSRISTFSVDSSNGSSLDAFLEDLGSLHEIFQDKCSSLDHDTGCTGKVDCPIQLCDETTDDDDQPELDDMSLASYETFYEDPNSLDNGTRHTALSIDSDTLDALMDGIY